MFYKMKPFHLAKADTFMLIGLKSNHRIRFILEISYKNGRGNVSWKKN